MLIFVLQTLIYLSTRTIINTKAINKISSVILEYANAQFNTMNYSNLDTNKKTDVISYQI